MVYFFFSSRRRHTRLQGDWSSDVCSSDLILRVENAAADFKPVRVGVNEARHNCLAPHIENLCARGRTALRAHTFDPVVLDDDVGVLQDFLALHRHYRRATQHYRAPWRLARDLEIDCDLLDFLL